MSQHHSDAALLRRAQAGDFDAFAELTEPHRQSACEFLSGLVGEHTAEDVFMKATLKAWRAIKTFNQKSSYRTWLFSIARYTALDELRKKKSRKEVSADEEESGFEIGRLEDVTTSSPGKNIEDEERNKLVTAAIQNLPETHRSVVLLYYYQNFQYSEIAKTLDISIGTVMSRLHNAKRKLAKILKPIQEDLI